MSQEPNPPDTMRPNERQLRLPNRENLAKDLADQLTLAGYPSLSRPTTIRSCRNPTV